MTTMRVTIAVASLVLLASGIALSFLDKAAAAGVTYSAAVLCLIFVFLPEFKRFKGLGIEAELLDRKIEEADQLLTRLRGITVPIAEMLLSTTARMGRWSSGMPRAQKFALMQRIEQELIKCGVHPDELERAKTDWHFYNLFDLSAPARQKVFNALDPKIKAKQQELDRVPQPITPERRESFETLLAVRNQAMKERENILAIHKAKNLDALPDSIQAAITNSQLLDAEEKRKLLDTVAEELEDVRHYVKYKDFRRPSVWFGSDDSDE